jgi:predicted lipoprotein with Yx(FWY)xxD motif
MPKHRAYAAVLTIAGLLLAGCGGSTTSDTAAPGDATTASATTEPPTSASPTTSGPATTGASPAEDERSGTTVTTGGSEFGTMLFDRREQAVYMFDKESTDRPDCYGACAKAWPPVLTDGDPRATGGVRDRLLGTTERRDGTVQVTYGGHPLYYYAHEEPGQVLCHDVSEFGGLWLVLRPDGTPAP